MYDVSKNIWSLLLKLFLRTVTLFVRDLCVFLSFEPFNLKTLQNLSWVQISVMKANYLCMTFQKILAYSPNCPSRGLLCLTVKLISWDSVFSWSLSEAPTIQQPISPFCESCTKFVRRHRANTLSTGIIVCEMSSTVRPDQKVIVFWVDENLYGITECRHIRSTEPLTIGTTYDVYYPQKRCNYRATLRHICGMSVPLYNEN